MHSLTTKKMKSIDPGIPYLALRMAKVLLNLFDFFLELISGRSIQNGKSDKKPPNSAQVL